MDKSKRESMLALVQERHQAQDRNGDLKTPYWKHCYGVAKLLDKTISECNPEVPETVRDELYLGALGHDLYEDTNTSREEIAEAYGSTVDQLIYTMTNPVSDSDREAYMDKLENATDKVVLIKFADLIDNITSVVTNKDHFEDGWIETFFKPIMKDTYPVIMDHKFDAKWQATANQLRKQATDLYEALMAIK